MPAKLYVVHGSHPCNTVSKALELKGIPFTKVEIPPPGHVAVMKALFGERTVPAIKFEDGRKLQGSRAILAELDKMVPEPALLPADPAEAERVLEAERWGEEVLQPVGRRLLWPTLRPTPRPPRRSVKAASCRSRTRCCEASHAAHLRAGDRR